MDGVTIGAERGLFDGGAISDLVAQPFRAARQALAAEVAESVSAARSLAEVDALERPWRALEASAGRCFQAFQSFDWCRTWIRAFAGDGAEPFVVTLRLGGEVRLVWPLMRTRCGPLVVLRWLSDPYGQYGDVLAMGPDRDALVERAWRWIERHSGADAVRLRHVREDATAHGVLSRRCRAGEAECAPYLDLSAFETEAAYEARYSKVQRRRRKRIRAELESEGKVCFGLAEEGAMARAIRDAVEAKRTWLAARGLYSRPLADRRLPAFLEGLARARGSLRLVASVLSAGDRPVSFEIGLRFKQRHYGFITAHDGALTDSSPARLHMDLSQRRALADRMRVFDLLVPGDAHKASWSSGSVPVRDFHAPLTRAGRLYCSAYLDLARPLARKLYVAAPAALRRQACRIVSA